VARIIPSGPDDSIVIERKRGEHREMSVRRLDSGQAVAPPQILGTFGEKVVVRVSPKATWLGIVDPDEGHSKLSVNLWQNDAVVKASGKWELSSAGDNAEIVFDPEERRLVVGPRESHVDRISQKSFKVLLVNLQARKPESYELENGILADSGDPGEISYEFSNDGRWLVTGGAFAAWRLGSGAPELVQQAPSNGDPTFGADGRWLALASDDGVHLFQVSADTIEDRGRITSNGSVRFSADGQYLGILTNGEIEWHALSLDKVLQKAAEYIGRNLTLTDWDREFPDQSYRSLFPQYPADIGEIEKLVRSGQSEKRDGRDRDAEDFFAEATRLAIETKSVAACTEVVTNGIRLGLPASVMAAADYAANVLPRDVSIRDLRGKARALNGDVAGAIEDFEFVVRKTRDDQTRDKRERWVQQLKSQESIPSEELMKQHW
jgi:hypothetical protein